MRGAVSRFSLSAALLGVMSTGAAAQAVTTIDAISLFSSRLFPPIAGASTAIVTAEDIERSPARTVQDILATVPGVQVQTLFGGVNGTQTAVDIRGFGAFATANTLVLINGRRLNDLDLAGVDLSTIPLQSIERIEVTRGNSGAVLYGDNAVGGVVNIVTKTGVGRAPSFRAEAGVGSFNQTEGNVSANASFGSVAASVFANGIASDGYRVNNHLGQTNIVGDITYSTPGFSAFLNLSADDQRLGLPGGRNVTPPTNINQLITARNGAATPLDHAEKQGFNATTGFTLTLWNGADLIVDGGVRDKQQQGTFLSPFEERYVDTALRTWSFTPRLKITNSIFNLPSTILTGVDYYDAQYDSLRSQFVNTAPIHTYDLNQKSAGAYWQHTLGLLPTTDISYGGRIQRTSLGARDIYNPLAPGAFGAQSFPLDTDESQHALHAGFEHRFTDNVTVFGRAARAFRTPNIDERLVTSIAFDPNNFFAPIPQNFQLKTQTSHDLEAGIRLNSGPLALQASIYDMHLKNEIHYNPVDMFNTNLDPTHRYGAEVNGTFIVNESLRLMGSAAFARAVFEEGPHAGNDVPLVSRYSGSFGFSWNIWQRYFVMDAVLRAWSSRRFDNDQANFQPSIPPGATMDIKLSGQVEKMFWSFSVLNVFDADYFDYGIASANPARVGWFNAYPLPGRSYVLKAGVQF